MNTFDLTKQYLNESIQTAITAADTLAGEIANAAAMIVEALLNNHKIISCGNGSGTAASLSFTSKMLSQFSTARPSLPAISLAANAATLTAIADDYHYSEIYAQQIKALGQHGDVLLVITPFGNSKNLLDATQTAQQRNMPIIALTGSDGGEIAHLLRESDQEIRIPSDAPNHIHEVQLIVLHCLCDIIDRQLFGTQDQEG